VGQPGVSAAPGREPSPTGRRVEQLFDLLARHGPPWEDLAVAYREDPALHGAAALDVILYPGLWALWAHRVAHTLWKARVPLVPRLIAEVARSLTLVEIHPGARIGRRCFIDHGAAVVIGETAVVGDDVMLYHGVTLGGHGWWTDPRGAKRHPTIGDRVTLGAGCAVLGPVTVGDDCRIGPHAVVLHDVPPGTVVLPAPTVDHPRHRSGAERLGPTDPAAGGPAGDGVSRPANTAAGEATEEERP
jgi:serine O-acetyltransferase